MMMHSYGLPLTDVTWVTAREERVACKLQPRIKVERADAGNDVLALK